MHHDIGDWLTWLFCCWQNALSVVSCRNFTISNTDNIIFMSSCRSTSTVYCNIACRTTTDSANGNRNKQKMLKRRHRPLVFVRVCVWCIRTVHRHLHAHLHLMHEYIAAMRVICVAKRHSLPNKTFHCVHIRARDASNIAQNGANIFSSISQHAVYTLHFVHYTMGIPHF